MTNGVRPCKASTVSIILAVSGTALVPLVMFVQVVLALMGVETPRSMAEGAIFFGPMLSAVLALSAAVLGHVVIQRIRKDPTLSGRAGAIAALIVGYTVLANLLVWFATMFLAAKSWSPSF